MKQKTMVIGFLILIAMIVGAVILIDFDTPLADRLITKCQGNLECYSEIDGGFARFFTIIHEDGTIEKVVLIEDYPVEIREVIR